MREERDNAKKLLAQIEWSQIPPPNAENAALREAQPTDQRLINLLCRIHRDGGHYIAEHGLDKAVEDADLRVAEQNAVLDELKKQEPVAWKDTCVTIHPDDSEERDPCLLGYDGWESLPDGTELYAAPVVQERQEPVGMFDRYGDSYIQIKPEYADETSVKLYAAPVVQPDKYSDLTTMLEGALAHAEVFGNGNISTEVIRKLIVVAQESNAEITGSEAVRVD